MNNRRKLAVLSPPLRDRSVTHSDLWPSGACRSSKETPPRGAAGAQTCGASIADFAISFKMSKWCSWFFLHPSLASKSCSTNSQRTKCSASMGFFEDFRNALAGGVSLFRTWNCHGSGQLPASHFVTKLAGCQKSGCVHGPESCTCPEAIQSVNCYFL